MSAPFVRGRDGQPVVEDRIFGFPDHHYARIGLDARNANMRHRAGQPPFLTTLVAGCPAHCPNVSAAPMA
jgi:hypothetical protein